MLSRFSTGNCIKTPKFVMNRQRKNEKSCEDKKFSAAFAAENRNLSFSDYIKSAFSP